MTTIIEPEMKTFKEGVAEPETKKDGPELKCTYYRFLFEIPQIVPYQELADEEILTLAEKVGTFDFLHSPEEDIYSPSDGTPYEKR